MAEQRNNYGKRSYSRSDHPGDGGSKRRNPSDERDQNAIGSEDTVYRYLCPVKRIGSIIGKGGEIAKQLRAETHSRIRIGETVPGCEERVVTIYSSSEETNELEDIGELVSPAQDALFRVHDRIVADESLGEDEFEDSQQVTVRMLVPSDQIGCIIGKGGQVIQNMRTETRAQIRVLSHEHLPPSALNSDELLQITGEPSIVRKALYQVASRLHDNPSRSQHLLLSSSSMYKSGGAFMTQSGSVPLVGVSSLMGPYAGYKSDVGDWSGSVREFSLRLVCPIENIGGVIGKGGAIINQIRQESGASIKVDSSGAEGDDCIISISAKESFEDPSPTIDAAMRLQPRCSLKTEKESGDSVYTTRLLVLSSRIGCLIGKGGAIITEMRNGTRAAIRILSKENLPRVASEDEEMVQITGDLNVASNALLQVIMRLKANVFEMEGALAALPPALPYLPVPIDMSNGSKYGNRDNKSRGRGYAAYSDGYGTNDLSLSDSYGGLQVNSSSGAGNAYGAYSIYSSGRSGGAGLSGQSPVSHGKHHGY
ncbi:KH domain-containing protein At4g18375-like [Diospyros lotus]|uniref:KH domain-containing protein At4g18375-like n=1 Tax=Diospyros lotus TaxID=55363 RepID=UPI00225A840B|nr:KH domain-containing protein At4g18375-like [Diospyros lotus]XP_052184213.1 KH domain-containing protein At4g18375-like [Diospyros lotus]